MYTFEIENLEIKERFDKIYNKYWDLTSENQKSILRITFLKFKSLSNDEYYLLLMMIHGLVYFKIMDITDELISEKERKDIETITNILRAEMSWDIVEFIRIILTLNEDMFLLKVVVKATIIKHEKEFSHLIPNIEEYYRTIWWLLPILSYKEYSKLLSLFQDAYFEKVYPAEFKWIKKKYNMEIENVSDIENFMIDILNDLSWLMANLWTLWIIKIRRKSYFSVYNKLKRKSSLKINDFVWLRIIFKNDSDMEKFISEFEQMFVIKTKKDFVKYPKPNWYKSIHYSFLYLYDTVDYWVELQLRTKSIDDEIRKGDETNHFAYSLSKKKWDPLFKEVNDSLEIIKYLTGYWDKQKKDIENI